MFDAAEYSSTSECFADLNSNSPCISKKKRSKNKRRFNDDQIKSLEIMFESETKLEPRKKLQLAKELGLQPRQVAIWFQNKRARWKSKQIEKDYGILLSNYNALASQFDSLKKENQSLLLQLQKLTKEMVGKPEMERKSQIQETEGNSSSDGESDRKKMDFKAKNNIAAANSFQGMLSDNDSSAMKADFLRLEEETELLRMVEPSVAADSSLTSADQDWGSLDSDDLIINQPAGQTYQWWDFWS